METQRAEKGDNQRKDRDGKRGKKSRDRIMAAIVKDIWEDKFEAKQGQRDLMIKDTGRQDRRNSR